MLYELLVFIGVFLLLVSVFPYVVYALGMTFGKKQTHLELMTEYPPISVVISAYNEERNVSARITNLSECDYPDVEVIFVDDCSIDNTGFLAREALLAGNFHHIYFIRNDTRRGTSASYNRAIAASTRDIVVVTDADVMFKKDALHRIITRLMSDDSYGAATGDLQPDEAKGKVAEFERTYRDIYGRMCGWESAEDSTFNFNGSLVAFKKHAMKWVNQDSGADDANIALNTIQNGYRAVYERDAVVYEELPTSFRIQYQQKIRRAAGLIESVIAHRNFTDKKRKFWDLFFPARAMMLVISPTTFFFGMGFVLYGGFKWNPVATGLLAFALAVALLTRTVFPAFVLNQIYLIVGLTKVGRNNQTWESTSSLKG